MATMWGEWLMPTVASVAQFHLAALIHWSIAAHQFIFTKKQNKM